MRRHQFTSLVGCRRISIASTPAAAAARLPAIGECLLLDTPSYHLSGERTDGDVFDLFLANQ